GLQYVLSSSYFTGPCLFGRRQSKPQCEGVIYIVLQWMTSELLDGHGPWNVDFEDVLEIAAGQGHIDIVKWLYERGIDWRHLSQETNVRLTWMRYADKNMLYNHCSSEALELAAKHGHLEVVQWIYNTRTD
ncbi:hypothetical protein JG687_00013250, partial [Phytophthora cactorum]